MSFTAQLRAATSTQRQNTMKAILPDKPDAQIDTAINLNRRRYYRVGVTERPDGTKFQWDDWVREFDEAKESRISTPSPGWKIVTIAVYDCGTEAGWHPNGWVPKVDDERFVQIYDGTAMAARENLISAVEDDCA